MRITLTGATGFLGTRLIELLRAGGHDLRQLSRRASGRPGFHTWDPLAGPPPAASLEGAEAVIHLAGEPVAHRWTAEAKRRIRSSRIEGTRNLVTALGALAVRPKTLICASAIGYYGSRGSELLDESSPPGAGFLPEVCAEWEQAAGEARALGIRVVTPRIGVVLGRDGGALKKMLPPFRLGAGGPLAGGSQWMSWIHVEDMVRLIAFVLGATELDGAINAVSPNPVTNADFTHALGAALHRPAFFPVPEIALRALYGEMAGILLDSQRAVPGRLKPPGSNFSIRISRKPCAVCYSEVVMSIPNVRRFRISGPAGQIATLMAVLPKGADVDQYVADASKRFDWKAWDDMQQKQFKVRVGQQKQKKAK